jgi:eukaryotic-like serine/threonine-protein kinase
VVADGQILDDRYRLERLVAPDGFGDVWQATDQVLARPVTVKLLGADRLADEEALARFGAEARLASSITHRNLARIFDYNDPVAGQPPFLVMEFAQGESLADLLAGGPLSVPATLDVLAQVAGGMEAASQAGLSRLDITPANVLVCYDGSVKVTDFGIGRSADPAADVNALGALAEKCLDGQGEIPAAAAGLLAELTDEDGVHRPESAAEVARRAAALHEQLAPRRRFSLALVGALRMPAERDPEAPASATATLRARLPAKRRSRSRLLLVPIAAVIVGVSVLLLTGRLDRGIYPLQGDLRAGNRTALVDGAAFRGLPVSAADDRLRRLGFSVRNRWVRSASGPAGLVISVAPTGRLPVGRLVTVFGSGPAGDSGRPAIRRGAGHHPKGRQGARPSPTGTASRSPKASSSPSAPPSPGPTPSPTGPPAPTPTASPTQTPTSSPQPSGSPTSTGGPSPTGSASPSQGPASGR